MKRDDRLVSLSRDHHTALKLGRRLLAGDGAAALCAELPALAAHFEEEEARLLPLLEANACAEQAARLRREHAQLRALFAAAAGGRREGEAGRALIAHVRFEERELFPLVERLLAPAGRVGEGLRRAAAAAAH